MGQGLLLRDCGRGGERGGFSTLSSDHFLRYTSKPRNSEPPCVQSDYRVQMINVLRKEVLFLR